MSTAGGVTTTDGQPFTHMEHVDLARLVFKRFGHDPEAATAAWRRLLGNGASTTDFMILVTYPEHTAHCEGDCGERDLDEAAQYFSRRVAEAHAEK